MSWFWPVVLGLATMWWMFSSVHSLSSRNMAEGASRGTAVHERFPALWWRLGSPNALCWRRHCVPCGAAQRLPGLRWWQMRRFSLAVFIGSVPQTQVFAELECYFPDSVAIGDDIHSLCYPSSFASSSLVFLLCSLFRYSFLFASSILNFPSYVSFEDLLQNSWGLILFGSEPSPLSPLPPSADVPQAGPVLI